MTDTVTHEPSTGLAITPDQTTLTPDQRAVLAHMGVENAPEPDLMVFTHVCQRTGLDPFARQIHMIGRQSSEKGPDGTWHKVTKYTIQTGIDGYRLIGRRAADRSGDTVSVDAPEWCTGDGKWGAFWSKRFGHPVAARVTIRRGGQPFTAVAIFDEYAQTKRDGNLTSMWEQRPAGQLAKCAEALAWRMAFPQDLSGIYVDDELHHADSPAVTEPVPSTVVAVQALPVAEPVVVPETGEVVEQPGTASRPQLTALHAGLTDLGITDRDEGLRWVGGVIGREVATTKELTRAEASTVIDETHRAKAEREGSTDD